MQFCDLKMSKMALADCSGVGEVVIAKTLNNLPRHHGVTSLFEPRWAVRAAFRV